MYTGIFAGFRAARLDAQMEEGPEGTPSSSDPDGGDPHPCPEDEEFFGAPDAESQEEAINRFMELRRRGSSGRTTGQQYLRGQPVAVVVWARQAPPGGPVHRADSRKT